MKTWIRKLNNAFAAVAFAEAGEHETALRMMGRTPKEPVKVGLTNMLNAITFAEAGEFDTARSFMGVTARRARTAAAPGVTLNDFLATVGLQGHHYCFGVVNAAS